MHQVLDNGVLRDATEAEIAEIVSRQSLPPIIEVPRTVTRRQARQALLLADLLDEVPLAIAALDDGTMEGLQRKRLAEIEWQDSLEFERSRPLVVSIGAALGLDSDGLDAIFIQAASL